MLSCTQDSSTVIHQSAPRTDMVFDGQYYAAVDRAYFGHSIVLLSVSCAIISCSVLFSTAVQSCVVHLCAEPMQVTWKMNDERDLICIRQMNESFTSRPCLRVNERSGR